MSVGRIWQVARLDMVHNARRFFFWFWLTIIIFMTWGLSSGNARIQSGDASVGGTEAWLTSEFAVGTQMSMLPLMIYGFFVAVAAGMLIIRDSELGGGAFPEQVPGAARRLGGRKRSEVIDRGACDGVGRAA